MQVTNREARQKQKYEAEKQWRRMRVNEKLGIFFIKILENILKVLNKK